MTQHVLAADVGGTKTNLGLYAIDESHRLLLVREATFTSKNYASLEHVVDEFLDAGKERIAAAGFGVAGPVIDGAVVATNLPWKVETESLAAALHCERVRLMNDLETMAYGALQLAPEELHVLNTGVQRRGNCAVIAAGTGLGQAFLFWDGRQHRPSATEGGHADFAPRNNLEVELFNFLRKEYSRVSYERVLSGPGLYNIFRFLNEAMHRPVEAQVLAIIATRDPGEVIGQAAVSGSCLTCLEAVDIFVSLYGAQAGNLALTVMAIGGIYVGGGIVTKLLPKVTTGSFMDAFLAKGRYTKMMVDIPVRILLNPRTAQIGAARAAADLLNE